MVKNSKLLFCSRNMHEFLEANEITSIQNLLTIPVAEVEQMSNFNAFLITEWICLKDRYNLLFEN